MLVLFKNMLPPGGPMKLLRIFSHSALLNALLLTVFFMGCAAKNEQPVTNTPPPGYTPAQVDKWQNRPTAPSLHGTSTAEADPMWRAYASRGQAFANCGQNAPQQQITPAKRSGASSGTTRSGQRRAPAQQSKVKKQAPQAAQATNNAVICPDGCVPAPGQSARGPAPDVPGTSATAPFAATKEQQNASAGQSPAPQTPSKQPASGNNPATPFSDAAPDLASGKTPGAASGTESASVSGGASPATGPAIPVNPAPDSSTMPSLVPPIQDNAAAAPSGAQPQKTPVQPSFSPPPLDARESGQAQAPVGGSIAPTPGAAPPVPSAAELGGMSGGR